MTRSTYDYLEASDKKTVVFTGGGTSGHINPALAIAKELKLHRPDLDIVFMGTEHGLEADIVPRHGYPFVSITATPFKRKLSKALFMAFVNLFKGKKEVVDLFKKRPPLAVVGTGGYVAGPVLAAAKSLKIPYIIHEQNAYPGRSNRSMASKADAVMISYEEARRYFNRTKRVILSGNPIDPLYFNLDRQTAREKLGIAKDEFFVLVSGGSLGARTLNHTVIDFVREHQDSFTGKILLVTGKTQYDEVIRLADGLPSAKLEVQSYLYEMPYYMAASDVYVCRAGAGTCAEVAALGRASIMVPYPYATGDHQTYNAKAFSQIDAAFLCPNEAFNVLYLKRKLDELSDSKRRNQIERQARMLAKPNAASDIVLELLSLLPKKED